MQMENSLCAIWNTPYLLLAIWSLRFIRGFGELEGKQYSMLALRQIQGKYQLFKKYFSLGPAMLYSAFLH